MDGDNLDKYIPLTGIDHDELLSLFHGLKRYGSGQHFNLILLQLYHNFFMNQVTEQNMQLKINDLLEKIDKLDTKVIQ